MATIWRGYEKEELVEVLQNIGDTIKEDASAIVDAFYEKQAKKISINASVEVDSVPTVEYLVERNVLGRSVLW